MQIRFRNQITLLVAVVFVIGLCLVDAGAQRRKRRSSRRVTHPVASPSPASEASSSNAEPKIISTADQNTADADQPTDKSRTKKQASKPKVEAEPDEMRQTIVTLSNQVTKLSEKLTQMEEQQRTLVDMERLTRAEQRAEGLRAQLRDVQAKESDLQGQLEEVDYALKPENIERVVGTFGTTHPEEAREQRRRQLESLHTRIRAQLDQLAQSRVRLEAAITTADAEVDLLRKRMDTLNKPTDVDTPTTPVTTAPPPEKPPEKPPAASPV
jgi:predicted  nucleic acid-binding Zn-ribbon protein